ncbi:MAG: hypothetical protein DUD33_03695 [Coriobacteriaceae bacterium]|jgi:hypothetical protein|nr:hypothetical protein [Olsenella sp.]MCI1289300.1 hypothetical protein [Olsenella sp.]RRF90403.1 MAG: hypothetical protein DUD33_03695 [Coriobacteriaceae bacterium]
MLQHDYLLEIIGRFVESVSDALTCMLRDGDMSRAGEVEDAIGELLDLDAHTAMALSPQSLVTMMTLSGVGESVAGYVSYALDKLARAYEKDGDERVAAVRKAQAQAIAQAFHSGGEVPPEFETLEETLS